MGHPSPNGVRHISLRGVAVAMLSVVLALLCITVFCQGHGAHNTVNELRGAVNMRASSSPQEKQLREPGNPSRYGVCHSSGTAAVCMHTASNQTEDTQFRTSYHIIRGKNILRTRIPSGTVHVTSQQ